MWEHWNGMLHNSLQPCNNILDSRINKQLKALYNQGLQAMPQDVFVLFQKSLKDLLQQPQSYKEKWVASVEAAKERKRYHEFGAYLQEQCFMRQQLGLEAPTSSRS